MSGMLKAESREQQSIRLLGVQEVRWDEGSAKPVDVLGGLMVACLPLDLRFVG
jgi:hypothetical protein